MKMVNNKNKRGKRWLLIIPIIICLSLSIGLGIKPSQVNAGGYVTDTLTVKIGYWGMADSTFVTKGTYHWSQLANNLPLHKVAYSFYQENKYGYNAIIDSATGFYISDLLDYAQIERNGISSISFYTKDVNVGSFVSFSYNELFGSTKYYFKDLSGNLIPKFADEPAEEEPIEEEPTPPVDPIEPEPTEPPEPKPTEPPEPKPTEPPGETGMLDIVTGYIGGTPVYAAEKKYKLISVSDSKAWKHKTAVKPMLALEDHWESYETTSYNQPSGTKPNYSQMSTGNRFRLLFGQSSPKESRTSQTAKYVHTLYITYKGVPTVVEDGQKPSGEIGQHKIGFNVDAGDIGMVQSLIDSMGFSSSDNTVMTIDKVNMKKNPNYDGVVSVELTYTVKKKGKAKIVGAYAGIEIDSSNMVVDSTGADGDDNEGKNDDGNGSGDGENKSGDKKKGDSADSKNDDNSSGKNKQNAAGVLQMYELDQSVAQMLTQTSTNVAATDKETLRVKEDENRTGPYAAAGAAGLCLSGMAAERIRFRKKL